MATENEIGQRHGVKNMMEGGSGIVKTVMESIKMIRKSIREGGSRESHKVEARRRGPREGPMMAIGQEDWSTVMGFVLGPTDGNTWEIGKMGCKSDTGST